jgi:hypothetical protein
MELVPITWTCIDTAQNNKVLADSAAGVQQTCNLRSDVMFYSSACLVPVLTDTHSF